MLSSRNLAGDRNAGIALGTINARPGVADNSLLGQMYSRRYRSESGQDPPALILPRPRSGLTSGTLL